VVIAPLRLARALGRAPLAPRAVGEFLAGHEDWRAFRWLVHDLFPDAEAEILEVPSTGRDRETERVWAFCRKMEERYFPIYETDEYESLLAAIPFARMGWSAQDVHDLGRRTGELLLLGLCALPFDDAGVRLPLLEVLERRGAARATLLRLPEAGLTPDVLHARLDGTCGAAAAEFADWLWARTDTVFPDADPETECEVDWTPDNVRALAEHWRRARVLQARVRALEEWLEADPDRHFAGLVHLALGDGLHYDHLRRPHACEITCDGIVATDRPLALPAGAAG
jgi:hypothetical protein